jgi:hypothetical protein
MNPLLNAPPSRLELKNTCEPSGDQIGSLSTAASKVNPRRGIGPGEIDEPDVPVRRRSGRHGHATRPLVRAQTEVAVRAGVPDDAQRLATAIIQVSRDIGSVPPR